MSTTHSPLQVLENTETRPRHPSARESTHSLGSKTACVRCRGQKLRCSKHLPSCLRCTKQRTPCTYPAETDRKQLAALRKASKARNNKPETLSQGNVRNRGPREPSAFRGSPCALDRINRSSIDSVTTRRMSDGDGQDELPPRALGLSLLEIYYERVYNAPLLFDKQSLFKSYVEGQVPEYLLRALFALASIFLEKDQSSSLSLDGPLELSILSLFSSKGRPWAESASREALSRSGQPSLSIIQTLESLTIYWFAIGDIQRADIHLTLAYRSCYNVGFNKLLNPAGGSSENMRTEIERRCFWACWATMCIAGQPKAYLKSAWLEAAGLPLPMPFDQDQSLSRVLRATKMDANWECSLVEVARFDGGQSNCVPVAELLKLIGIWAKTQVLVKQYPGDSYITEILNLSCHATSLYKSPSFPPSPRSWNDTSTSKVQALLVHSLYHLCQMTLNRAMIPRLCGRRNIQVSTHIERKCAQTVLEHARLHGRLIVEHLAQSSDVSTIYPIVGFTAFSAAAILALSMRSRGLGTAIENPSVMSNDDAELTQSLIGLVHQLSRYWKTLQRLSTKLHTVVTHLLPADPDATYFGIQSNPILDPDAQDRDSTSIETEHSVISSGYIYTSESEDEDDHIARSQRVNTPHGFGTSARNDHANTGGEPEQFPDSGLFNDVWQPANLDISDDFASFVTSDTNIEGLETLTALFPSEWSLY